MSSRSSLYAGDSQPKPDPRYKNLKQCQPLKAPEPMFVASPLEISECKSLASSFYSHRSEPVQTILITVVLQRNGLQHTLEFPIHRERSIGDLYERVAVWLKDDSVLPSHVQFDDFALTQDGRALNESESLQEGGLVTDSELSVKLIFSRP